MGVATSAPNLYKSQCVVVVVFSPLSWQLETTAASVREKAGIVYTTALGKSLIVSLLGFLAGKFSVF